MRETLASLVDDWQRLGEETAVVLHRGNRSFRTSYGALARLAGRFAADLERRQIGAGERVLIWGENSPEWIAAFFGCMLRGVIAVPLDAAGKPDFVRRVAADTAPRLVVGDVALLAQVGEVEPQITFQCFAAELPPEPLLQVNRAVREDTPFQIVFTSGTTSEPKGIVHTHRNVLASLRPIEAEIGKYRRYERWFHPLRFLHTLPFSHVFGQFMGLWIPAVLGAEVHLPEGLDPARYVALIRRERVSVLVAVPRVLELLSTHLEGRFPGLGAQLASLQGVPAWKRWWIFRRVHRAFGLKFWAFICGGATLPPELENFWNGLGFALIQGYGMTETAALVTLNHPFKVGRGTLGKALPGREVKLSDEGEILVRGDMLAAGNWRAGRFEPRTEEWLKTGDLAQGNEVGELRFSGRRGDVIVTAAGMNVYPADLQAVLLRQPGVKAAVVVPCELGTGPEPVAVLILSASQHGFERILATSNTELAPYQQIRRILQWPSPNFPYTATGKLLRREVAAWACATLQGATPENAGVPADALLGAIAEVTREQVAGTGDASRLTEDLHLDSLGRVQLQSLLEQRFGVEIRDEQMAGLETLGQLRAVVGGGSSRESVAGSVSGAEAGTAVSALAAISSRAAEAGTLQAVQRPNLPYPRWPWGAPARWLRAAFLEAVAMPLVRLLGAPKVRRQAAPPTGPALIIANHVNTFDVPLVEFALPSGMRNRLAVAMSAEVLGELRYGRGQGNALLRLLGRPAYWLITALFHVFPLPRLSGFRESFAYAGEVLDRGGSVLVFPEGRRGWTGELQPFRPGIGLLVQASQVPVVPVAIQGAGAAAGPGGRWFRRPGLAVEVGRAMVFAEGTAPEEITRQLEEALRALKPS